MSMHSIYIEVSDEITTVIERLKNVEEAQVALVVPRGAILLQSIVNLKLAKKAAADAGKQIVLVSTDKIGRNLATQLGIPVAGSEKDAPAALRGESVAIPEGAEEPKVIAGVRIHRYYDEEEGEENASDVEPIIIPKEMMKEEKEEDGSMPETPEIIPAAPVPPVSEAVSTPPEPIMVPPTPITRSAIPEDKDEVVPTETTPVKEKKVKEEKTAPPAGSDASKKRRIMMFSFFVAGLLVLGAIALSFLFLPATTATIAVPASEWEKTFDFTATTAASSVSADNTVVPAEQVTAERTDTLTFQATGTKKVGEAATGTATLYNYDSTSPQTLPAGSKITASGRSFTTQATVTVPGYSQSVGGPRVPGSNTVAITADEVGAESNLDDVTANPITGPGINLSAKLKTSGGSSRDVKVVSASDIANARVALGDKLREATKTALADTLKDRDLRYNESADSFTLEEFSSTVASNAEVDSGEVQAKGILKRLVIDFVQIKSAAENRILAEQENDTKTIIDRMDVTPLAVTDNTTATFTVQSAGKVSAIVPTDTLRTSLAGKTEAAGRELISNTLPNTSLVVSRRPAWWPVKRFPYSPRFLTVDVVYE